MLCDAEVDDLAVFPKRKRPCGIPVSAPGKAGGKTKHGHHQKLTAASLHPDKFLNVDRPETGSMTWVITFTRNSDRTPGKEEVHKRTCKYN